MVDHLELTYQQWVQPFYMRFLHGNFRHLCQAKESFEARERFIMSLQSALSEIEPGVIDRLWRGEWRARLCASWFCGLKSWRQYQELIGEALLESQVCYAGQGYCVALACFGDRPSTEYLSRYLDIYLPQLDKFYDQHWAMPALIWIDERLATNHSSEYLKPGGLWDRWIAGDSGRTRNSCLEVSKRRFNETLLCAFEYFGPASSFGGRSDQQVT